MRKIGVMIVSLCFLFAATVVVARAGQEERMDEFSARKHRTYGQDCQRCHVALQDVKPPSHDGSFRDNHRAATMASSGPRCSSCHTTADCSDCHAGQEGISRPADNMSSGRLIHDPGWIDSHGVSVMKGSSRCESCHRAESCTECHQRVGLDGEVNFARRSVTMHPLGFMNPLSPRFHGRLARANIFACAACHGDGLDRESTCTRCH
ncbi:MAG: hypothetical protein HYV63_08970 [Candidatus Schekmanbacteria bacterium]|nr:hypothetical protein [Candidatus Schekmanbacteria bacterium]